VKFKKQQRRKKVSKKVPPRNEASREKEVPLSQASREKLVVSPITGILSHEDTGPYRVKIIANSGGFSKYEVVLYNLDPELKVRRAIERDETLEVQAGQVLGKVTRRRCSCRSCIEAGRRLRCMHLPTLR
jgi:hypothetical protein